MLTKLLFLSIEAKERGRKEGCFKKDRRREINKQKEGLSPPLLLLAQSGQRNKT